MNYWSKLSMKDRAEVMKLFLDKGISDLDTIRREYNTFAGGGDKGNKPKFKKSNEAYYDYNSDTVFAPDSTGEYYYHELFHARPDTTYLQKISPLYSDLNDEKLIQMGADLPFVKRFEGDPGHFYSPEEIGARRAAASFMLRQAGVKNIDDAFLNEARKDELKYGNNFRDLLHMYSNENLLKLDLLGNQFAGGGDTNPGMTGMMKSKLATAAHFGNPTARRMTNYDARSYTWPGEYEYDNGIGELKRGNVFVGSYDNLVTPQIQDTGNGLIFVDNVWSPENDQRSYMQSLKFNNEKDARYFGEHYKEVAPMMNLYSNGGKIHIKPSHRGRLTELKKRTDKSEAELYKTGGPTVRKMITFARNARKWKHGLGGNLYDGTTEDTQQMAKPNIFQRPDGSYFYSTDGIETDVTPINVLGDNPALWTYTDSSGKIYRPAQIPSTNYTLTEAEDANPLERAANNYFRELDWRAKNDPSSIALQGKYTMPLVLSPLLGKGAAVALANPYVDAALTSGFGAHGLQSLANGKADWTTTLEIAPLGRLARPLWNAGKEGLQYAAKAADNTARYMSPSYDLYRTIGETTPKIGNRFISTNGQGTYDLFDPFGRKLGEASLFKHEGEGTRAVAFISKHGKRANKVTEDIYNTAVQDITSAEGRGLESGWDLMSPERTLPVTERFPHQIIGTSQGHDVRLLTGTTSRPLPRRISGDHYQEIAPKPTVQYNEITGEFEAAPSETVAEDQLAINWKDAVDAAPQITSENAASITPEQWDAAYRAAYERGDKAEGQRLWDLWFDIKAAGNKALYEGDIIKNGEYISGKNLPDFYHNTDASFTSFDVNKTGQNWEQSLRGNKKGVYLSAHDPKSYYGKNEMKLKLYSENPEVVSEIPKEEAFSVSQGKDAIWEDFGMGQGPEGEVFVLDPKRIKSAEPFTLADDGSLIDLTKRANFNINDIRYGLLPFIGLGTAGTLYRKQE